MFVYRCEVLPPSVNSFYGRARRHVYLKPPVHEWRQSLKEAWVASGLPVFLDEVAVEIFICPKDRRKRDLDNCIKSCLDALEAAGALRDDHQVAHLMVQRCPCRQCPLFELRLTRFEYSPVDESPRTSNSLSS